MLIRLHIIVILLIVLPTLKLHRTFQTEDSQQLSNQLMQTLIQMSIVSIVLSHFILILQEKKIYL